MLDMLKKFFSFAFFSLCMISFYGCGDDSSSTDASDKKENEQNENEKSSSSGKSSSSVINTDVAKSCSEFGAFKWVAKGSVYNICEEGVWVEHDISEEARSYSPGFDPCKFNFGAGWQASHEDIQYYRNLDYIAVWLGANSFYNFFEKRMVDVCMEVGATPMIYAYVIAEFGKKRGLDDCNVAKNAEQSLCMKGAQLIREFFQDSILYRYSKYASGLRNQLERDWDVNPDTIKSIWLIEPDFYQYSESGSNQKYAYDSIAQVGGGIPDDSMAIYFKIIADTIRSFLPAAQIAIDISPWIADVDSTSLLKWYSRFDSSIIDYASTSGGIASATSNVISRGNKATWTKMAEILGKPLLADAGYGTGGANAGHSKNWDNLNNIKARIEDGVVGVMQMDAALDYVARLDTIRPQITSKIPWCNQ